MSNSELLDVLKFLWTENRFGILYLGWLLQTWYMLGLILK